MKIPGNISLITLFLLLLSFSASKSQDIEFSYIDSKTDASFRALSVVDDLVVWVSGSNGWFGRSSDGGQTWEFDQVSMFEEQDFRTIYAFDINNAIIANAGSPAYILRTTDGGENWIPVYQDSQPQIFLDGIDFWDESEGIIYGDPIDSKMTLLKTRDAGFTWEIFSEDQKPEMANGEASFAASGTAIRCFNHSVLAIASGGMKSRIYYSTNKGVSWEIIEVPILQGSPSTGIFSMAFKNENEFIVVGGDYLKENQSIDHVFTTSNAGKKWKSPSSPTSGYRECIEYLSGDVFITTGPTGTELSKDNGDTWQLISGEEGMHVVRKARNGSLVIMAGKNGKIILIE